MSTHKRHHYVPRFYLERWARQDNKIGYYHWANGQLIYRRIGPKGAAVEEGLYSLQEPHRGNSQAIETDFFTPRIDGPGAQVIAGLVEISGPVDTLNPEQRQVMSNYLIAQRYRSPDYISHVKGQGDDAATGIIERHEEEYLAARAESDPPTLEGWMELKGINLSDQLGVGLLPDLLSISEGGEKISSMSWHVLNVSTSRRDLLTSDRPVIFSHGIGLPECVIILPLSPQRLFLAANDRARLRRIVSRDLDSVVTNLNFDIVRQAARYVFSTDEKAHRFVEKHLSRPEQRKLPKFHILQR